MSEKLSDYLIVGTVLMIILSLLRRKKYGYNVFEVIVLMLFLAFSGVLGAFSMFFVENGSWGGQSFFGAVLFAPVFMFPIILIMRKKYGEVMSLCAPAECIMLATLKIHCLVVNCCKGNGFFETNFNIKLQLVESIVAIIVMIILLILENNKANKNKLFLWYLVIYSSFRFVLNTFRKSLAIYAFGLPAGHFWALVSIVLGLSILFILNNLEKKKLSNC